MEKSRCLLSLCAEKHCNLQFLYPQLPKTSENWLFLCLLPNRAVIIQLLLEIPFPSAVLIRQEQKLGLETTREQKTAPLKVFNNLHPPLTVTKLLMQLIGPKCIQNYPFETLLSILFHFLKRSEMMQLSLRLAFQMYYCRSNAFHGNIWIFFSYTLKIFDIQGLKNKLLLQHHFTFCRKKVKTIQTNKKKSYGFGSGD